MRKLIVLLFLTGLSFAEAAHLKAIRDAVIREDSVSSSPVIHRLAAGVLIEILDESRLYGTGYWKVRSGTGITGYTHKFRVRKLAGPFPGGTGHVSHKNLEVNILNVGQGDAIIIRCPDGNHEMLIDAAELNHHFRYSGSNTEFKNYMSSYQAKGNEIEVVVSTHPHSDHIAGMEWVASNYGIGLYVDNGMEYNSGTYRSLETSLSNFNVNRARLTDSSIPNVDFCPRADVNARILRPIGWDKEGIDDNNYSVIVRLDYGNSSFLFTGDAEKEMEAKLLEDPATNQFLDVDFLKVGHHGSHSSTTAPFLDVVTPVIAAISCGAEGVGTNGNNRHPRLQTIDALLPYLDERNGMATTLECYNKPSNRWDQITTKASLYITNNDGDLIFLSDGNKIWRKGDH